MPETLLFLRNIVIWFNKLNEIEMKDLNQVLSKLQYRTQMNKSLFQIEDEELKEKSNLESTKVELIFSESTLK